jgi:hypothetical protein
MIIRTWRATATATGAHKYAEHFENVVLQKLSVLDGFRGAFVLLNDSREVVEIKDLTLGITRLGPRRRRQPHRGGCGRRGCPDHASRLRHHRAPP